MKKQNHKFDLLQYTCIAASFLGLNNNIKAQSIYTDIDPDIILDADFELAGVDMDNNGSYDFAFINISYTYQDEPWEYSLIQRLFAGPYASSNEIAGSQDIYYFPYALEEGNIVGSSLSFQNWGYQRLAWRLFLSFTTWMGDTIEGTGSGGNWFPETIDHYLGVHFKDDEEQYHYGWIRCSVEDSGRVLIIKDYAYEKQIDLSIEAGDKIGYVGIESSINQVGINIYSFDNKIYILSHTALIGSSIEITNLHGQNIYTGVLNQENFSIALPTIRNICFVHIYSSQFNFIRKIYI